jgi:hypothetical protein
VCVRTAGARTASDRNGFDDHPWTHNMIPVVTSANRTRAAGWQVADARMLSAIQDMHAFLRESPQGAARSSKKLRPVHGAIGGLMMEALTPSEYQIICHGAPDPADQREATVEGEYGPKQVDIAVRHRDIPQALLAAISVKAPISGLGKNRINQAEAMRGETVGLRRAGVPYGYILARPRVECTADGRLESVQNRDIEPFLEAQWRLNQREEDPVSAAIILYEVGADGMPTRLSTQEDLVASGIDASTAGAAIRRLSLAPFIRRMSILAEERKELASWRFRT